MGYIGSILFGYWCLILCGLGEYGREKVCVARIRCLRVVVWLSESEIQSLVIGNTFVYLSRVVRKVRSISGWVPVTGRVSLCVYFSL